MLSTTRCGLAISTSARRPDGDMYSGSLRIAQARSSRNNKVNEHAADLGKRSRAEGEHPAPSDLRSVNSDRLSVNSFRLSPWHPQREKIPSLGESENPGPPDPLAL